MKTYEEYLNEFKKKHNVDNLAVESPTLASKYIDIFNIGFSCGAAWLLSQTNQTNNK